jgi:hemoglobin-like flavoprotein
MATREDVDVFRTSLNRCLAAPRFLVTFYELFMSSSDEVRRKFRATDFDRQNRVLADSLYLMAVVAQGEAESPAWAELDRLAKRHTRTDLDIRPELYDTWLDCLVHAARRHDPQFDPRVEEAWRSTLSSGIEFLRSRY